MLARGGTWQLIVIYMMSMSLLRRRKINEIPRQGAATIAHSRQPESNPIARRHNRETIKQARQNRTFKKNGMIRYVGENTRQKKAGITVPGRLVCIAGHTNWRFNDGVSIVRRSGRPKPGMSGPRHRTRHLSTARKRLSQNAAQNITEAASCHRKEQSQTNAYAVRREDAQEALVTLCLRWNQR